MLIQNIKQQILMRAKAKGLSISSLEQKAKLKKGTAGNIINGKSSNPTIETLHAIATVLECTVDNLMGKIDEETLNIEKGKPIGHELTINLLLEIMKYVLAHIEKKNYKMTMEAALYCTKEAYIYCLDEKDYSPNKKFIEWLVDKNAS